jgi:gamma-glutamylcyclotransferase (GGCT)/AIG2-like uncharacterized protein YtfP
MVKLFVYGTLKRGGRLHQVMGDSQYLGDYETENRWTLADFGAYPGMIPGDSEVKGEMYEVSNKILSDLDWVEGAPTLFNRNDVKVRSVEGGEYEWVKTYVFTNLSKLWDYDKTSEWVI